MRWIKPDTGDVRVVKRFLIFPKTLLNPVSEKRETRWLEFAHIKQQYYLCWCDVVWEMKGFDFPTDKYFICYECISVVKNKNGVYKCEGCGAIRGVDDGNSRSD